MPVTRESIIQNLYSTSASAQPDATLELGEIAINAADEALFIKNASGTVKKLSATTDLTTNLVTISTTQTVTGDKTFSGNVTFNTGIIFEGSTADANETTLTVIDPTADQTITFPNATGTVALVSGSDTQVMFNDGGSALGGDSGLTYNKTTDSLTITGDLAVNGSDITTSGSGTATVFNTNALTLNLGGAATAITMGDSTTATTTIRGGTLVGNTTTQNLFNTTATTLNMAGAATTVAIGNTATAAQTVNMFTASTGASTYNFATGTTAVSATKTLNIGNGGASLSSTGINIGTGSSGTVAVNLGSTGNGLVSVNSSVCYLPQTVYFGSALTIDNAIFSTNQTMVTPASIILYTVGNMYLGGDNAEITVMIGDYDGNNDATLITVDESSNAITLNADSGVTINQDLAVNGGDITTTVTGTATLFNTSATTFNLGGAATAITMGATSGTTTTIRGGTLVGNTTTQNVFNATATTVNAFGAATTVNMGGASTNTVFAGTVEIDGTNALQFPDGTIQVTRTPDFLLFNLGII